MTPSLSTESVEKPAHNTAIVYSIGSTHRLYINVPEKEAERRWAAVCDAMTEVELRRHAERGERVQRSVVTFTDEIEIWGDAGQELQELAQKMLDDLARGLR